MIDFLLKIMSIDSSTNNEKELADYLINQCKPEGSEIEIHDTANGQKNVFFKWGQPQIIFCTHLDTVRPYIPPTFANQAIYGRGACDAKGQIAVMYEACKRLYQEHNSNFGLLLTAGEETTSYGAKTANEMIKGCEYVVIGEPTDNKMIQATKGVYLFAIEISGKTSHSGYPEQGDDAIKYLHYLLNQLSNLQFPEDNILGKTTYNVSMLKSEPNAANVIADKVMGRIMFRTTFASHDQIENNLRQISSDKIKLTLLINSLPLKLQTVEGIDINTASFGSDAPYLKNLGKCLMYGPGSILTAHTTKEMVTVSELEQAVRDLMKIFSYLQDMIVR